MGWIIDAVIGVLLLIVLLINLFMGFQKCGLNNAFTALNVVLSCVLASVISGALISGPLASVVEGSGEGSELMGTLLSIGLFVVLMLVFSLIFSIVFFFVKLPLKKIKVKSKAMKIVGRVVSILLSVGIYASFFWIILGVVHTAGIPRRGDRKQFLLRNQSVPGTLRQIPERRRADRRADGFSARRQLIGARSLKARSG